MSDRNALGKAVMALSTTRRMIDKLRESNPESPRTLSSRDPGDFFSASGCAKSAPPAEMRTSGGTCNGFLGGC